MMMHKTKKKQRRGLAMVARKLVYLSDAKFETGVKLYDQALPIAMKVLGVPATTESSRVFLNNHFDLLKQHCTQNSTKIAAARKTRYVVAAESVHKKESKSYKTASDAFLKSYAWQKVRMQVLITQGRRCACCGATPETGAVMNVDHIKPRKLFPSLALDINNLQVLCSNCNHGKGNWDQSDWRETATCDTVTTL